MKKCSVLVLSLLLLLQCIGVTAFAAEQTIFSDDFAQLNWNVWSSEFNTGTNAGFFTQDGVLLNQGSGSVQSIISAGNLTWKNYAASMDLTLSSTTGKNATGLLFRFVDVNNFYMLTYSDDQHQIQLYKRSNGTFTMIKASSYTAVAGQAFNIKAAVSGTSIKCYVNDEETISATDTAFSAGKIGIRYYSNGDLSSVDNMLVVSSTEDPEPSGVTLPYTDSFDTFDDRIWTTCAGGFTASDGVLTPTAPSSNTIAYMGSADWANYAISSDFRVQGSSGGAAPGLIFRVQDASNFYMLTYSMTENELLLYKRVDNVFTLIQKTVLTVEKNTSFNVKVYAYDNEITAILNGTPVFQAKDSTFTKGKLGYRVYITGDGTAIMDNFHAEEVSESFGEVLPEGFIFVDDFTQQKDFWTASSNIQYNSDGTIAPASGSNEAYIIGGDTALTDYRAEAVVNGSAGKAGIVTHIANNDGYKVLLDYDHSSLLLYKKAADSLSYDLIAEKQVAAKQLPKGEDLTLSIAVKSDMVSVWINTIKQIDYNDSNVIAHGSAGVVFEPSHVCDARIASFSLLTIGVADQLPGDNPFEPAPDALDTIPSANSNVFYVATDGNDGWSGTHDRPNSAATDGPFATIQAAIAAASASKGIVVIRGGTYYLSDTIQINAAASGVTLAAYDGETPVISGGKPITSQWSEYQDGIWKTDLGSDFADIDIRQLFVGGDRATRSREPDGAVYTIASIDVAGKWVTLADGTLDKAWEGMSGIELNSSGTWHYNRQSVASLDAATGAIRTNLYLGVQASGLKLGANGGDWLYLENSLAFVDEAGEWYYNKAENVLYYKPVEGQNPNDLNMVIPCLETLVKVEGSQTNPVQNVTFYGLEFAHTTWEMTETERRGIQGGFWGNDRTDPVYAPPAAVLFRYAEECRIQNTIFRNMGEGALAFGAGANSNLVYGCQFYDVGANALQIGYRETYTGIGHPLHRDWDDLTDAPAGNVISNNVFNACCSVDLGSCPIWVAYSHHNQIDHNTIQNCPYTAINVGWRWGKGITSCNYNLIQWNYVENAMTMMGDGAGIYMVGEGYGAKMVNNYINGSGGIHGRFANGIYTDEGTNYTEVAYNFIVNYGAYMFHQNQNQSQNYFHDNWNTIPPDTSPYGAKTIITVSWGDSFGSLIKTATIQEGAIFTDKYPASPTHPGYIFIG